ncbi:MAG: AI-2E family transporter [Flavobacteriales bacterium]|nr:AI-2E family transporter [Flavobacteriales bacterium]
MTAPATLHPALRFSILTLGFCAVIYILYVAQGILLPVIYAAVVAALISPAVDLLQRWRFPRILAILVVMVLLTAILAGIIVLLIWQLSLFSDAWPEFKQRSVELWNEGIGWASRNLNISEKKINAWMTATTGNMMEDNRAMIGTTLASLGESLAATFLTPVYVFMMVLYRDHLVRFVHRLTGKHNEERTTSILDGTRTLVQSYLVGLAIALVIFAVLNVVGLLLIGIKYAILLGIIGALFNLIPYIGGLVAVVLFMAVALVTGTPMDVLYVFLLYVAVQFIDNNFVVPKVVGSKVKLNPLASILSVIAGAALWGISGMFLSLPLLAIVKLVLDRIPELEHWGFLLGDPAPPVKAKDVKASSVILPHTNPKP